MTKLELQEKARQQLKEILPPGSTVYTILRHVSQSGMFRIIDMQYTRGDSIERVPPWLLVELGFHYKHDKKESGYRVSGCGMDMGFAIVHDLSTQIYKGVFICLGDSEKYADRCPASDHVNKDHDYTPHNHKSGGYALRHKWL